MASSLPLHQQHVLPMYVQLSDAGIFVSGAKVGVGFWGFRVRAYNVVRDLGTLQALLIYTVLDARLRYWSPKSQVSIHCSKLHMIPMQIPMEPLLKGLSTCESQALFWKLAGHRGPLAEDILADRYSYSGGPYTDPCYQLRV